MNTPTLFKEYIWLVNTIYHAGRISLVDIKYEWGCVAVAHDV